MMELPIRGIIPPMVTPLNSDNELDDRGLENLINHMIDGGVHGIFLLGTTGEATSFRYELRKELITKSCKITNDRVPLMVGITDTSPEYSVEMAEFCKDAGVQSVVVAAPYYFPLSQSEVKRYFDNLVPRLPLPFLLYNMPSHTKVHFTLETVKHIRELGALGIKDSSGDMLYLLSLIDAFKDYPEFSVIAGTEIFLPETILQGGHGAVAGGANMFPQLFVELYHASQNRDYEKITFLRKIVMKIYNTIYNVGNKSSRYIKGTKSVLAAMDVCNDYVAYPMQQFEGAERELFKNYVEEIKEMMDKYSFI